MPIWLLGLIESVLKVFLPWFFSGSRTDEIKSTPTMPGTEGLDTDTLSGTRDLGPVVMILMAAVIMGGSLSIAGCAAINVGGAVETHEVIFVQPGSTGEIAEDRAIKIVVPVKQADGSIKKKLASKNLAGCVAMPKSVYREMLVKAYPDKKAEVDALIAKEAAEAKKE